MKKILDELDDCGFENKINYDLEASFNESLEDPDFLSLVSELKLDKKYLMKYTSILNKSKVEYSNCRNCKNILSCKNQINGFCYLPRVDNNHLIFEYKMCKLNSKYQKDIKYQSNMYFYDIPEQIKNANMKDIYLNDKNRFDTIEWLHKFIKDYKKNPHQKGLYLTGNFGCGKTYLVSATFNSLAHDNYKSAIIFWPEFLSNLKSSFQTDFQEKFETIKKVPLLLIDDIGAENTTEWSRDEVFCPLVQYRMDNNLTTFFTSNLTLDELEQHFMISKNKVDPVKARRIIERIKQLTVTLNMVSDNLRK